MSRRGRGYGQAGASAQIDSSAVALQILTNTAEELSDALIPLAELAPQGSVVLNSNSVANGTISGGISIQWPCNGFAVGLRMSVQDATTAANPGGVLIRVVVDGTFDLFPSGSGGGSGYLSMAMIQSSANSLGRYVFRRRFTQATYWTMYLNNTTSTNPALIDVAFDYINTSSPYM